jgi:hypothetical protein
MSLPAIISYASVAREPLCGEVTCLKLERQCKPFVYLNPAAARAKEKHRMAFLGLRVARTSVGDLGSVAVAAGRASAALTLLLTGFSPGVWVLLARLLIGIAHSASLLNGRGLTPAAVLGREGTTVPWRSFCVANLSQPDHEEPAAKTILYKPFG